jgi:glycerol-3-phosphate dehydrogenase
MEGAGEVDSLCSASSIRAEQRECGVLPCFSMVYTSIMSTFDLIVIGGGIAGLGIADEASARGLSTVVLEAERCCSQTSDNTLRIIHGGFRYLQTFDFRRVQKSLADQTAVLREVPQALAPLPCLMPLARFGAKSRLPVACAGLLYGALMRRAGSLLPAPRVLSSREVESQVPLLQGRAPHGALCWHDAVIVDPSRVTEYLVSRCAERGVTIEQGRRVTALSKNGATFDVRDERGAVWHAPNVVNAVGPWLSSFAGPEELQGPRPLWCKGINLVVSRQLDPKHGVALQGRDGRLFFCVPRASGTAVGTWYEPHCTGGLPPNASEVEIETFLRAVNEAFGKPTLHRSDVIGVDVGVLPMGSQGDGGPVPLAHEQLTARDGYVEVVSTKYTTFKSQAKRVLDLVHRP